LTIKKISSLLEILHILFQMDIDSCEYLPLIPPKEKVNFHYYKLLLKFIITLVNWMGECFDRFSFFRFLFKQKPATSSGENRRTNWFVENSAKLNSRSCDDGKYESERSKSKTQESKK